VTRALWRAQRARKVLGVASGLRRRLLVMLLVPLILLALLNAWLDYRSADTAAAQQDNRLLAMVPLLADSVISEGIRQGDPPVMLMAPAVEEFLKERPASAWAILDPDGNVLLGEKWLAGLVPTTPGAELHS
jgi:two-component system sensor histidine kinase TctE